MQKQKFADVCKAIGNADNKKKVMKENKDTTAATLDLMGTLCDSLAAKAK